MKRDSYLIFIFLLVFLVGLVKIISATSCDSDITLSATYTGGNSNSIYCDKLLTIDLEDTSCTGMPPECWNGYGNATLSLPPNISTTSNLAIELSTGDSDESWTGMSCNTTGLYLVNATLNISDGTECNVNFTLNFTGFSTNPNLIITFPSIPENQTIGSHYVFNITINNTGDDNATLVDGTLTASDSSIINVSNGTINVTKIVNATLINVTLNISFLDGGDTYVEVAQLDYYRSSGIYYGSATGTSNTFHVNYDPSLTTIPNISIQANLTGSLEMDSYHSDTDTYDSDGTVNYTWSGQTNVSVIFNKTSRIFSFTGNNNFTGAENITVQARDQLNASVNQTFSIFFYNSSSESCNGVDDDGDTLDDENEDNDGLLTQSCCPGSCTSAGSQTCTNGTWTDCAGYTLASGSSGGGSGRASSAVQKSVVDSAQSGQSTESKEEKASTPAPAKVDAPRNDGGSVEKVRTIQEKMIEKIANNRVKHIREVHSAGGKTKFVEKIRNIDFFSLQNVRVTLEIPKDVVKTTDDIIEITPYKILNYDPKVQFNLGSIAVREEKLIEYVVNKQLTKEDIERIIFSIDMENVSRENEREELFEKTHEVVNITTKARVDEKNNETEFTIDLGIRNDTILYDTNVYTEIPKCMVEIIEEVMIESDIEFEIVARDPLVMWHFKTLGRGDQLKYVIKSIADEDCLNEMKTYAVALHIVSLNVDLSSPEQQMKRIYLPVAILVLLIVGFFASADYLDNKKHHIRRLEDIVRYIHQKFKNGFKTENIESKLVWHGFDSEDVTQVMKYYKKHRLTRFVHRHIFGGEILFLTILIIFNVLDFLKFLPGDMDFLKKIISWTLLSYLLYRLSLMKILFGDVKYRKILDITLLILFFSLIFKLIINFAKSSFVETRFFSTLLATIGRFAPEVNIITLYLGFVGLILVSVFISFFIKTSSPSFFYAFTSIFGRHKLNSKHYILKKIVKLVFVYLTLLIFYITVYNFAFEWLAMAIDASILMVAIAVTIFTFIRREYHLLIYHKIKGLFKVQVSSGLERIVSMTDSFNIKFFNLLPYRKFIYLAIIGVLILHLIAEAGIFLIPYASGMTDTPYFKELGKDHSPLFNVMGDLSHSDDVRSLYAQKTDELDARRSVEVFLIYLMNIMAVFFLLVNPMIIWLHMHKERNKPAHKVEPIKSRSYTVFQFLFIISMVALFILPVFKIDYAPERKGDGWMYGSSISGIDIKTQQLDDEMIYLIGWVILIGVALGINFLIYKKEFYKQMTAVINTLNISIVLVYLGRFYLDIHRYFVGSLEILVSSDIFLFINIGIFFIASSLFYIFGILLLALELFVRGEIYMPRFIISIIKVVYKDTDRIFYHLTRHHHLRHLRFYEHHIEAEHGKREEYLHKHIKEVIKHTHDNEELLMQVIRRDVRKEKHDLHFIEEHLLEHNWPEAMVKKALNKIRRDPRMKKEILKIRSIHDLHKKSKSTKTKVQEEYKNHRNISKILRKHGNNKETKEILSKIRLRRKDRKKLRKHIKS